MRQPKYAYVYGLKDSRDGAIHYVGKSDRPERRKREHLKNKTSNAARVAWLDSLTQAGLEPELVILAKVLQGEWRETEWYWIARGCEDGWPLTNIADGGPNGPQIVPPDYGYMRSYVRPDLWHVFDALSIREKDAICMEAAGAMARSYGPWLEKKIEMHQYGMHSLIDDEVVWVAAWRATELVEQKVLRGGRA